MQPQHEATLTQPFTVRERSYSCKAQWNSIGNWSTSTTCNPIYNAEPIRDQSAHDPRMIRPHTRTVSQPSHRRGRSSRFRGRTLYGKKHRLSCICYLSKTHFVRDFLQNSIGNSSTSTTCNPIYSEGTILELQITMEFHRQLIDQHHLQSHLHCGKRSYSCKSQWNFCRPHMHEKTVENPIFTMRNRSENDPRISENDPTTHETVSHPSHSRGRSSRFGDGLCMEKHRVSCICCYLSKTHFVRDFLQNSIGNSSTSTTCNCKSQWNSISNSSTSTTCNPIYNAVTILQLQITMEFCRPHMHEKQLKPHLQCGTDPRMIREYPRMIRPHTRPSRTRRTAEVDHRRSGTDFVWKNIGFRASAISQKRISCETSFKTPSATHPPAPLAIPFTVRERS